MASTLCMRPRASIVLHPNSGVHTLSAANISVEHHFDRHVSIASNWPRVFNDQPVALFRKASILVRLYGVSCLSKFVGITVTSAPVPSLNLISCLPSTAITGYQASEFLVNSRTSTKIFEISHVISLTVLGYEGMPTDDLHTFRKSPVLVHAWQRLFSRNLRVCELEYGRTFCRWCPGRVEAVFVLLA